MKTLFERLEDCPRIWKDEKPYFEATEVFKIIRQFASDPTVSEAIAEKIYDVYPVKNTKYGSKNDLGMSNKARIASLAALSVIAGGVE